MKYYPNFNMYRSGGVCLFVYLWLNHAKTTDPSSFYKKKPLHLEVAYSYFRLNVFFHFKTVAFSVTSLLMSNRNI